MVILVAKLLLFLQSRKGKSKKGTLDPYGQACLHIHSS